MPVIAVRREEKVIGGAGNVARNLAEPRRALPVRRRDRGRRGGGARHQDASPAFGGAIEPHLVVDATRPTSRKVRFVSEHYSSHLLRADWELATPVSGEIEARLIERVIALVAARRRRRAVRLCQGRAHAAPDPRRDRCGGASSASRWWSTPRATDFSIYRGADRDHAQPQGACRIDAHAGRRRSRRSIAAAAAIRGAAGAEAVLVTLSEEGMLLDADGAEPVHVPAYPVRVRDVSGAGDTVAAVLAALARGRRRFRGRHPRGECGGLGGGRQARYRDGDGGGAALAHPAGRGARGGGEDRFRSRRWRPSACASGAPTGCASASPTAASTFSIPAMSTC